MKSAGFLLLVALLVGGCAPVKQAQVLSPRFAAHDIRQLALAPVVFADEPLDRYFGATAAAEIHRQAARELQARGYEVVLLAGAGSGYAGPPVVPPAADPIHLAPAVPAGSDGVVQIRVDHFLDAGLSDERARIPLDIYATAALIAADRQLLWQGEGRGQGAWHAGSRLGADDYFTAAARLADSLFATLPPR